MELDGGESQEAAVFFVLVDRLVGMGVVPDVRDEATGRRNHHAVVMGLLALRPSVLRFARAMDVRLRDNDHKGGWEHEVPRRLIERVRDEVQELDDAVNAIRDVGPEDGLVDAVWREAADVGNFAMMAAEVATDAVYPEGGGRRAS